MFNQNKSVTRTLTETRDTEDFYFNLTQSEILKLGNKP